MKISLQFDPSHINWDLVPEILKRAGMSYHDSEVHKMAFGNSFVTVFVFDEEKLIGFGRAISDGVCHAAIYDVAVLPEYQGKGIGKMMIEAIIGHCPNCSFILYASPGKEKFYEKLNFRKMKTGMALFKEGERMKERGFTE